MRNSIIQIHDRFGCGSEHIHRSCNSEGWARGSSSLRWWLQSTLARPTIIDQDVFERDYKNKTGIMYEAPVPGDIGHIDLWNKGDTGSGYYVASKIWFGKLNKEANEKYNHQAIYFDVVGSSRDTYSSERIILDSKAICRRNTCQL